MGMNIDPTNQNGYNRRTVLRSAGIVAFASTALAGCTEEGAEDSGGSDEPEGDMADDEAENDEGNGDEGMDEDEGADDEENGEADEPDYEGWFDDTENYDGTEDMTGQDEITVAVGAGDDGLTFDPAAVRVSEGTTVVWEWTGEGGQHNVMHEDGEFESELADEEGFTFEHTVEDGGVYRYLCAPHEAVGMVGAVTVGEDTG